jgi:hypothetical protein
MIGDSFPQDAGRPEACLGADTLLGALPFYRLFAT